MKNYRKAILEKNVHSIFRIAVDAKVVGSVEDLRKAVIDQNLYSIFRLIPDGIMKI